jgi:hypothetical protein
MPARVVNRPATRASPTTSPSGDSYGGNVEVVVVVGSLAELVVVLGWSDASSPQATIPTARQPKMAIPT